MSVLPEVLKANEAYAANFGATRAQVHGQVALHGVVPPVSFDPHPQVHRRRRPQPALQALLEQEESGGLQRPARSGLCGCRARFAR
jgi:hypothetical protein